MRPAKYLSQLLVSNEIINKQEQELYSYGISQGISLLYNILTVVFIGWLFNMIWESIIFMVAYGWIRPYAGGYHSRTKLRCYFFSIGLIVTVLLIIKYISFSTFALITITLVSSIIILILAPVEDKNKPLDEIEKTIFKKRTNIRLIILIGLTVLFWILGLKQISICIIISLITLSFMLLLGKFNTLVQNSRKRKNKKS
ncbi:MAG: accessory gene regulator B family protein [Bacillota bacterium]|nr:accessory gene regulator B family protein [Bacillota bacterium]